MEKKVLITGCNRGLGLALVKVFISNNYKVYALIRSKENQDLLEKEGAIVIIGDVSCNGVMKALSANITSKLDVIINNAAIAGDGKKTLEYSVDILSKSLETNIVGAFRVIKSLESKLHEKSLVINITSRFGSFNFNVNNNIHCTSHYKISKSALNMLTLSLHMEYNSNFKTVAIHPGEIVTSMKSVDAKLTPEMAANNIFNNLDIYESGNFYSACTGEIINW